MLIDLTLPSYSHCVTRVICVVCLRGSPINGGPITLLHGMLVNLLHRQKVAIGFILPNSGTADVTDARGHGAAWN